MQTRPGSGVSDGSSQTPGCGHSWRSRHRRSDGQRGLGPGGLGRPCLARMEPWALLPAPRGPPCPLSCSAGSQQPLTGRQKEQKVGPGPRAQRNGFGPSATPAVWGTSCHLVPGAEPCSSPPWGRPEEAAPGLGLLARKSGWREHEAFWGALAGWQPRDKPRTGCHCSLLSSERRPEGLPFGSPGDGSTHVPASLT